MADEKQEGRPLAKAVENIRNGGPDRVVINVSGEAVSSLRARRDYNIRPDIIFIRDDGWSLGAPLRFESVAEALWHDKWIGTLRKGSWTPVPYLRVVGGAS